MAKAKKKENNKIKKNTAANSKRNERNGSAVAVSKIIVDHKDEITHVIDRIKNNSADRLVISIPAGSDLLLSSVSLKLMLRTADKADKKLVLVTDDPTGQRMARLSGFAVRQSMNDVDDAIWSRLEKEETASMKDKTSNGASKVGKDKDTESLDLSGGDFTTTPSSLAALEDEEEADFVNRDFQDDIGRAGRDSTVHPPDEELLERRKKEKASDSVGEKIGTEKQGNQKDESKMDLGRDITGPKSSIRKVSEGDFEMTIDDGRTPKVLDRDKPVGKVKSPSKPASKPFNRKLIGRDFSAVESSGKPAKESEYDELPLADKKKKKDGFDVAKLPIVSNVLAFFSAKNFSKIFASGTKKRLVRFLVPGAMVLVIIGAFMFWYLPEIFVDIKVESLSVEFQGEVTASTAVDSADSEELVIPAKEEVVTKNGSDNGEASGTAVQGEKASGQVIIFNRTIEEEVTLPSGTILTNGGLNFILQESVTLEAVSTLSPTTSAYGTVVAEEIGSEYNLEAGTEFVVADYALGEVSAANSDKFTGGEQSEYEVVSQEDIDRVADEIEKTLNTEAKDELQQKAQGSRWEFVEKSLTHKIEGDVKSDVPVGAQEENFNVTVNTRSSALYYDSEALGRMIEELLLSDIDGDGDMEGLKLSDDLEKQITVKEVLADQGKIVISVDVSGFVMPELDEERIENALVGRGWADGLGYLKNLDYVSGDPEIEFYPEWFPRFMRRMPARNGRITVDVENVAPEEETDESDEASGEEPSDSVSEED